MRARKRSGWPLVGALLVWLLLEAGYRWVRAHA